MTPVEEQQGLLFEGNSIRREAGGEAGGGGASASGDSLSCRAVQQLR